MGQVGPAGVMFSGTNEVVPIVPAWPHYGLDPIPNQSMLMTYSSAPVVGTYLFFYKSILDKIALSPENINGNVQFTIKDPPDFALRDANNKLLIVNTYSMAFSANGSWMVVDLPWQGFVRINLATFEMQPFAPSMQQGSDYSSRRAQLSISNDGRQVVVLPNDHNRFKVYDLSNCSGTSLPVSPESDRCLSRDYYNYVSGQIPNFRGIYRPRFINNTQLSFSAIYNFNGGTFNAASYVLTAPGQDAVGIDYLGMGDSYASGEGAFAYTADTDTANNTCHLSGKSYPFVLSSQLHNSGHTVACSGAVTNDVIDKLLNYNGQVQDGIEKNKRAESFILSTLANYTPGFLAQSEFIDTYKPQAVTLSIGGNDFGFSDIVESCVSPISDNQSCYPTYEDRVELARRVNGIFDKLVHTYKTVAKPGKRVYVVGYPQIAAPGGNCALNVHLDAREVQLAADIIDYLNGVIQQAAGNAGVRYVDVSRAFEGHRMCEAKSFEVAVNGFTMGTDAGVRGVKFIGNESYHPNALGHDLLAKTIRLQTDNLRQAMPAADPALRPPAAPPPIGGTAAPVTNRLLNIVLADPTLSLDVLMRGQYINVAVDSQKIILKSLTQYRLVLRSNPVELGTAITNSQGVLQSTVRIPAGIPPGFHTLHAYGPNMLGQPVDIVKTVYVAASPDDYNGDGVLNTVDPCAFLPSSGVDVDGDGIDDACDGFVAEAPVRGPWKISSSASLTDNSITITRSGP
jgi:hypothetical protein